MEKSVKSDSFFKKIVGSAGRLLLQHLSSPESSEDEGYELGQPSMVFGGAGLTPLQVPPREQPTPAELEARRTVDAAMAIEDPWATL